MILSFFAPLHWNELHGRIIWDIYLRRGWVVWHWLSCRSQRWSTGKAVGCRPIRGQDLLYWPIRGWDWFHILQTLWWVSCGFHGLLIPRINGDQQILSADYANLKISFSLKKTSQIYWWWIKYKLLPSHNKENTAKYSRLSSHLYKLSLSIQISTNSALTPKGLSLRFFGGSLGVLWGSFGGS